MAVKRGTVIRLFEAGIKDQQKGLFEGSLPFEILTIEHLADNPRQLPSASSRQLALCRLFP